MTKQAKTKKAVKKKSPKIGDQNFTIQDVIDVIYKKGGYVTAVAKALKVSHMTVWRWSKKYPEIDEAFEAAVEEALDFTESQLMEKIKSGDTACIIFHLKTKGKTRGYIERVEQQHSGEQIIIVRHVDRSQSPNLTNSLPLKRQASSL